MIYPRGGWSRAAQYVWHRLRRLPDRPHRIGRGVAAGVMVSFTPLFGFHFLSAAAASWLIGGNILAALLATFIGNPITTPFIAMASVRLGHWILGIPGALTPHSIFREFGLAGAEIWNNILSPFGDRVAHWDHLAEFNQLIFIPYCVGGTILGIAAGIIAHYLTVPVIKAYHRRRAKKMADRIARLHMLPTELPADSLPHDRSEDI